MCVCVCGFVWRLRCAIPFALHSLRLQFNTNGIFGNKIELQHILNIITCSFSHEHSAQQSCAQIHCTDCQLSTAKRHSHQLDFIHMDPMALYRVYRVVYEPYKINEVHIVTICHVWCSTKAHKLNAFTWLSTQTATEKSFLFDLVLVSVPTHETENSPAEKCLAYHFLRNTENDEDTNVNANRGNSRLISVNDTRWWGYAIRMFLLSRNKLNEIKCSINALVLCIHSNGTRRHYIHMRKLRIRQFLFPTERISCNIYASAMKRIWNVCVWGRPTWIEHALFNGTINYFISTYYSTPRVKRKSRVMFEV